MGRTTEKITFMVARFDGTCATCSAPLAKGANIAFGGRGNAYHPTRNCVPESVRHMLPPMQSEQSGGGGENSESSEEREEREAEREEREARGRALDREHVRALERALAQENRANALAKELAESKENWINGKAQQSQAHNGAEQDARVRALGAALASVLPPQGPAPLDESAVRVIVTEELAKVPKQEGQVVAHRFEIPSLAIEHTEEHCHKLFPMLLRLLSLGERVFLSGPAGSGKTTAVERCAAVLKRPLFVVPPVSDPFQLLGFIDAGGVYQTTEFRRWADSDGGILLLDELDASLPGPLTSINAGLANGLAVFPDGQRKIAPGNLVVANGNTWGFGGTSDYVGRAKLDAATLNRFSARLEWDYDISLESAYARAQYGATTEALREAHAVRARLKSDGIKLVWSMRDVFAYCKRRAAGMTAREALEVSALASLPIDARSKVIGGAL